MNNFHTLEVVDRVSETQLQVGENSDWIFWRLKVKTAVCPSDSSVKAGDDTVVCFDLDRRTTPRRLMLLIYLTWRTSPQLQQRSRVRLWHTALKYFRTNHGYQRVFQFEIIIDFLMSIFWFIWIPMLWVYDQYKYVYSYSEGFWRLKL